jgi:uncharacterized membrane protein YfhO
VILAADNEAAAQAVATLGGATDAEPGTVQVLSYAAGSIRLHTSAASNALLVLSETYYPGWTARLDGQAGPPVLRGDVLFRVVPVPAGEHDIELRFEPASLSLGLGVSGAALLLMLGALVVPGAWRAVRHRSRPGSPGRASRTTQSELE